MSQHFIEYIGIAGLDSSWLARLASLLVLPFAQEDLALILGGYIVVNKLMPAGLVAICIYGGMVGSDFALYGIGVGARHVPWLNRWAVDDRVMGFGEALKRNLFGLVAFCRVVPGADFIAFVACGWARVPLGRFLVASLLVSALYLPLILYLVVVFGDALDDHLGLWAWPFLLGALSLVGFIRHRVFALQEAGATVAGTGLERTPVLRRSRDWNALSQFRPAKSMADDAGFLQVGRWFRLH